MIDLYTGLRLNQAVILAGPCLSGKTTIWKTIVKAIDSLQTANNSISENKTTEVFKKYSILSNFMTGSENGKFSKILAHHLFPHALNIFHNLNNTEKSCLLTKLITQCENSYISTIKLEQEQSDNKKIEYDQLEKWILLDSNINDTLMLDQILLLKTQSNAYFSNTNKLPDTIKFIFESSDLNNINPSIINKCLLVVQQDLDWHAILESRLYSVCLGYSVPQAKITILQEYSIRFFVELQSKIANLNYKSILHGGKTFDKLSFNTFILGYINLIDCLLNKFCAELKRTNSDDISNWRALKPLCSYAFFWCVASYLTNDSDMCHFNEVATEIVQKSNCEFSVSNLKLQDSEIDVANNKLKPFLRSMKNMNNKEWIILDYQYHASLIRLCIENSRTCLIYSDIGLGKTTLIEKILQNKYDFTKINNTEPDSFAYETILRHAPFCRNKKGMSINGNKFDYILFIDDLNTRQTCEKNVYQTSATLELIRQIIETRTIYSHDDDYFLPLNSINLILTCTYPGKSPNYLPLTERLTKHLVPIHLNPEPTNLIESIFSSTLDHWLEEFPAESILFPRELAQSLIKSMGEIYITIKENLKPTPQKSHYMFNFKDVARVMQGVQLLASKSKVVPAKISKKHQQDQSIVQMGTILKLFTHEIMRVFGDRLTDTADENLLKNTIKLSLINNFCLEQETDGELIKNENLRLDNILENVIGPTGDGLAKPPKKVVTFKAGLINERNSKAYKGALITQDQLGILQEDIFFNVIFSKFIIKQNALSKTEKSAYLENNTNDLMNAATASLDSYEHSKNVRLNFFFHDEAIRHLARLTRCYSMNRGSAVLISEQNGLGRTNSVRLSAFLAKMKYFEARITNDEEKSEKYLRAVLRQCCLVSGIKGAHSILYVKTEFHSHKILENLCIFVKTGVYPGLFSEKEILHITGEIVPTLNSTKRSERTQLVHNNFLISIQEKCHVVISLESGKFKFYNSFQPELSHFQSDPKNTKLLTCSLKF